MVLARIRRSVQSAGAKLTLFFTVIELDHEKNQDFQFSLTGLELHKIAREAKRRLLDFLTHVYGRGDPRGIDILNNRRWEHFSRRALVATLNRSLSDEQVRAAVLENCCALVREVFEHYTDGEMITVTIDADNNVDVKALQREPFDFRECRVGTLLGGHGAEPHRLETPIPKLATPHRQLALPQDSATKPVAARIGRNAVCPCGSGKRYKHCHGALGDQHAKSIADCLTGRFFVRAKCPQCAHVADVDWRALAHQFGEEMRLNALASRMRCQRCGSKGAGWQVTKEPPLL